MGLGVVFKYEHELLCNVMGQVMFVWDNVHCQKIRDDGNKNVNVEIVIVVNF